MRVLVPIAISILAFLHASCVDLSNDVEKDEEAVAFGEQGKLSFTWYCHGRCDEMKSLSPVTTQDAGAPYAFIHVRRFPNSASDTFPSGYTFSTDDPLILSIVNVGCDTGCLASVCCTTDGCPGLEECVEPIEVYDLHLELRSPGSTRLSVFDENGIELDAITVAIKLD